MVRRHESRVYVIPLIERQIKTHVCFYMQTEVPVFFLITAPHTPRTVRSNGNHLGSPLFSNLYAPAQLAIGAAVPPSHSDGHGSLDR